MFEDPLVLLRYLSATLGVAIPFAGAWFFEFTQENKATGKRVLTRPGRWAVVLALISLGCAGVLTVWTDHDNNQRKLQDAQTQKEQEKKIENERQEVSSWREKTIKLQQQAQEIELKNNEINERSRELLSIIVQNVNALSPESRKKVAGVVEGLHNVEDIRKQFPVEFAELMKARSGPEIRTRLAQIHEKKLNERTAGCGADVPLQEFAPGYSKGQIFWLSNQLAFGFLADPTGVQLALTGMNEAIDLKDGYNLVFGDTESPKLLCGDTNKKFSFVSCRDWVREQELATYKLLQEKPLTEIKIKTKSYPVPPQVADAAMRTFACIKP